MNDWVLRIPWVAGQPGNDDLLLSREWLVANGLGGYASGTVGGVAARRYHSLLIAALPAPLGRQVMLNQVSEMLRLPDGTILMLGGQERALRSVEDGEPTNQGLLELHGADYLTEFRLDMGLPVWRYDIKGFVLEKRVLLPHRQNTVHINYRLLSGEGIVRLKLRPAVHLRPHESNVSHADAGPYKLTAINGRLELSAKSELPALRFHLHGKRPAFTIDSGRLDDLFYRVEENRGYDHLGHLWTPGYFRVDLLADQEATLVASTESWETILALSPAEAFRAESERRLRLVSTAVPEVRTGPARELLLAADQFIITPAGRVQDAARARAAGDEIRAVIAGYHWFTDWGRDTMISLEGLTLTTGRHAEAGYILRAFAHYVRDGLIPNYFPEGENEGVYHTADASLWFFHAVDRYLAATNDRGTLRAILPKLQKIVDAHLAGTRFGIGVDPADGLLRQGAEGYQLTWMDAKVGDWVVTPRRGKAVEINALWYNALRLMEGWVAEEQGEAAAAPLAEHAKRAGRSFNERFWYSAGNYLYDIVDGENGDDAACRPNQLFAISLPHPVLGQPRWEAVVDRVRDELLTPVGLRSLSGGHPDYKAKYYGDLRARDAAYHQGTVWGWLIGPYIDAWLKVHPDDRAGARDLLKGFVAHLGEAGVGSISEVFDAESPFTPRGCIAQAWSVAEVLRCWALTATVDFAG
jgi:predicted glycogen debranching enzyme